MRVATHLARSFGSDLTHAAYSLRGLHILACNGRAVSGSTTTYDHEEPMCLNCRKALASGTAVWAATDDEIRADLLKAFAASAEIKLLLDCDVPETDLKGESK